LGIGLLLETAEAFVRTTFKAIGKTLPHCLDLRSPSPYPLIPIPCLDTIAVRN